MLVSVLTRADIDSILARIEANHKKQLEELNAVRDELMARFTEIQQDVALQPKPKPEEEQPESTKGFVPFSARKRNFERAHRKDQSSKK